MVAVRRKSIRLKLIAVVIFCIMFAFFFHVRYQDNGDHMKLDFYRENHILLDSMNVTVCKLPKYDLYDPSIRKYIDKPATVIECGNPQPYLTYMDWDGMLYVNHTELEINNYLDFKCTYETVTRDELDDYKVVFNESKSIDRFPKFIDSPVIRVNCFEGDQDIYRMVHSQIKPQPEEAIKKNKAIPPVYPSVLILTIDSMSRGNFIRCLPETYKYLVDVHKIHIFKGLNKVADNTYPNMMALLAGFMAYPRKDMPHMPYWMITRNSTMKKFDDMPIIWKDFDDLGYVTFYAEEYLDAIFSLLAPGFLKDPVDYYYRSTYVSLKETLSNIENNKLKFWDRSRWRYCLGNEPSYKYMLNYTEEFLTEMANLRYFALSFFVEMSHEYLTDIQNMDSDIYKFFKKLFDNHSLDNTIIMVMGDHGHRFDDIRSTFIGRIEERMPFLGIILPEYLKKSHPHLESALTSHSETLLSWYDIHEMLIDISLTDFGEQPINIRPNAIGKSILRPFNDSRTCTQIGILPEYCMCDREAEIARDSKKAIESSNIIVDSINDILIESPNFIKTGDTRSCAILTLSKILTATVSMKSFSFGKSALVLRVTLEVLPSKGRFEAAVEYTPNAEPHLLGDINRINKYGDQPSCIMHDILRLYCYCI